MRFDRRAEALEVDANLSCGGLPIDGGAARIALALQRPRPHMQVLA
jgi:hypothetical protein